ncbi:MAG: OmpA family protein [Bacteroidales bacterium]|jgi:outer membrane protein OmpA-like peptidoglycan-associated protein/tetratricopeptide (TPR) repeat protein|nr:OmpA family protein [Bacteroidales bacterium]
MNKIFRLLFTFFCVCAFTFTVAAQDLKKADKAFAKQNYTEAIRLYKQALAVEKSKKTQGYMYFQIAEAYYRVNKYQQALGNYKRAVELHYNDPTKQLYGHYGDVLVAAGEYKEAQKAYKSYITKNSRDAFARIKVSAANFADTAKPSAKAQRYEVRNIQELNTAAGEFAPALWGEKMVFTSSRKGDYDATYSVTGDGFEDLYETKFNSQANVWQEPRKMAGINTNFNDGSFAYDKRRNIGYVMQCNGRTGVQHNCNIYTSRFDAKTNTWSFPEKFQHFSTAYSSGHPTLTPDGSTMYFISNNPVGKGGTDIWITKLDTLSNMWSKPELADDKLNTPYNEFYPNYVADKGLYYSSNGMLGYGGFDIYFAKQTPDGFASPENIGEPFNSSADDFSYTPLDSISGVFASNRIGGVGDDDLYYFEYRPMKITACGTVVNTHFKPIANAIVVITNTLTAVSDTVVTDAQGQYCYTLMQAENDYKITAFKSGFFVPVPTFRHVSTVGMTTDMQLDSIHGYDLNFVLDEMIRDKEYKIENIYYDLDKYDLRPASIVELNKVVALLKANPEIAIQLNSHTDERASDAYNMVLSDNRAKAAFNYLVSQGISPTRLAWRGWGETAMVFPHAQNEDEHQANRRTTFTIMNFDELQLARKAILHQEKVDRLRGNETSGPIAIQTGAHATGVYFRLQLLASRETCTAAGFAKFKATFPNQEAYCSQFADGYYHYLAGRFSTYEEAEAMKQSVDALGYNSMILAYNNYERISLNEALKILRKNQVLVPEEN